MMAAMAVLAACGSADDDGGERDDIGGIDPEERGGDQPLASESTSVQPYVQGLLDDHAAAVDEILANPELARDDDDSPVIQSYVEVYEPDSDVPEQVLASWVEMAERGERARPAQEGAPMNVLRVDGDVEIVADDEVRFPVCDEQNLVVEGPDGEVVDEADGVSFRGEGTAVHVDGRWYLRRIDLASEPAACASEGQPGDDTGERTTETTEAADTTGTTEAAGGDEAAQQVQSGAAEGE